MKKFYNHCNAALYNEAIRVISTKSDWHNRYKRQVLSSVVDDLERGVMIRTEHGGHTIPFNIEDVHSIVNMVDSRFEMQFYA